MESLFKKLLDKCTEVYKERLVTLAIFGSWAGQRNRPESDVDILVVAKDLSKKRLARVREFGEVENALEEDIQRLSQEGIHTYFSPIFKTPDEVDRGSLLFLDMLYELTILFDRNQFFSTYLLDFKKKLDKLGARRVTKGEKWYWILKPDYKQGDTFEI